MNTFKLTVSSPDREIFNGDAVKLDVRTTEGELAVMAGHTPFAATLADAPCKIITEEREINAHAKGGLLNVGKDATVLLSSSFEITEKQ